MYVINIKFNRNHSAGGGTQVAQLVYDCDMDRTVKELRFDSRQSLKIALSSAASTVALKPTLLPVQWLPKAIPLEVKRPGVKVTTRLRLVQRFRMRGAISPLPTHVFLACLVEDTDSFVFTFHVRYVVKTPVPNVTGIR
jgi:hypothetical protein